jgi:hypothetical protein
VASTPAAAASAFVVAAAMAFAAAGGTVWRRAHADQSAALARQAGPLELVALEHDRDGNRFIVRGIVRNPATVEVDGLVAAVSVFGANGAEISSGHAAVAAARLPRGAETPFVVILTDVGEVDRYHLSFRTAAGVVPHLDKRASSLMTELA